MPLTPNPNWYLLMFSIFGHLRNGNGKTVNGFGQVFRSSLRFRFDYITLCLYHFFRPKSDTHLNLSIQLTEAFILQACR